MKNNGEDLVDIVEAIDEGEVTKTKRLLNQKISAD